MFFNYGLVKIILLVFTLFTLTDVYAAGEGFNSYEEGSNTARILFGFHSIPSTWYNYKTNKILTNPELIAIVKEGRSDNLAGIGRKYFLDSETIEEDIMSICKFLAYISKPAVVEMAQSKSYNESAYSKDFFEGFKATRDKTIVSEYIYTLAQREGEGHIEYAFILELKGYIKLMTESVSISKEKFIANNCSRK